MPKQKTKKAAAKRLKRTATGKLRFKKSGSGHLLSSKSRKCKRALRKSGILSKGDTSRFAQIVPN